MGEPTSEYKQHVRDVLLKEKQVKLDKALALKIACPELQGLLRQQV